MSERGVPKPLPSCKKLQQKWRTLLPVFYLQQLGNNWDWIMSWVWAGASDCHFGAGMVSHGGSPPEIQVCCVGSGARRSATVDYQCFLPTYRRNLGALLIPVPVRTAICSQEYVSPDSVYYATPAHILTTVRKLYGGSIDLDPASDDEANQVVKATKFYSAEEDGLAPGNPWSGKVGS